MLYRTRLRLFLFLSLPMLANISFAQGQWRPFDTNSYDPSSQILNLPSVFIISESNTIGPPQYLYNTILQHVGDREFELISTEDLPAEEECTGVEVLNAIPQMRLELSTEDVNALVGCSAVNRREQADLETGLLMSASWTGLSGVPNSGNGIAGFHNISGSIALISPGQSGNWPVGLPAAFRTTSTDPSTGSITNFSASNGFGFVFNSSASVPFISLAIRENTVESYSYSTGRITDGQPRAICNNDLLAVFNEHKLGDSAESTMSALDCAGFLGVVTISAEGERQDYQWELRSSGQLLGIGFGATRQQSQYLRISFLNGITDRLSISSTVNDDFDRDCTVEEIVSAAEQIQIGDLVSDVISVLKCGRRAEFINKYDGFKQTTLQWGTSIPSSSPYTADNRQLFVLFREDAAAFVQVLRY